MDGSSIPRRRPLAGPRLVPRRLAGPLLAGLLALALAPGPAIAAEGFSMDVARPGDFVAQTNLVQCVGASMQMMLNMVRPKDDRSARTQLRLQRLARAWSEERRDGRPRRGASVGGWAVGLNVIGAGPYRLVGTTTLDEALRLAAQAIRETGRPVGLLMWRGRHAWVMSGFRATADPLRTDAFRVTAAIVQDPLFPHGSSVWGQGPRPGSALSPAALGEDFVPRRVSARFGSLSGKYVLVLPYETDLSAWHARAY